MSTKQNSFFPVEQVFLFVDLQGSFTMPGEKHYQERPCIAFIKEKVLPFLVCNLNLTWIRALEIISDYRQPRPGDLDESCVPGTTGYKSLLESEEDFQPLYLEIINQRRRWVKCMNSPVWVREGIGEEKVRPGLPYEDPARFTSWLNWCIGEPRKDLKITLCGLTLDCCVLCVAQALRFRGYNVNVLREAVDVYQYDPEGTLKEALLVKGGVVRNWAHVILWGDFTKGFAN